AYLNPHAARSNLPAAARRAPVPDPRGGGADGVDGALAVNAFVVRGGLVRTHAKHDDPCANVAPDPAWEGDPDARRVGWGEAQQRYDGLAPEIGVLAGSLHRDGVRCCLLMGSDGHSVDAARELAASLLLHQLGVRDAELARLGGAYKAEVIHVRVYVVDDRHGRSIWYLSYF
ncbi:MAG: hypothetical protein ACFNLW_11370, partial [Olsenella sp.]